LQDKIGKSGDFENFPHYKTFLENFPYIIDLTSKQVVMLSNLSWWVLKKEAENIKKFFNI
jgi:hypothetical protein